MIEQGSGQHLVCPACGTRRAPGARFCAHCGLDYWRVAAGDEVVPVKQAKAEKRRGFFGRSPKPEPAPAPAAAPVAPQVPEWSPPPEPEWPDAPARDWPAPSPQVAAAGASAAGAAAAVANHSSRTVAARKARARRGKSNNVFANLAAEVAALPPRTQLIGGGVIAALLLLLIVHPWTFFGSALSSDQSARPTPASKNAVVTNFFRTVRDPAAVYAVQVAGTIQVNAAGKESTTTIGGNLQVKGDDLSGSFQQGGTGTSPFKASVVRVGNATWAKPDGTTAWHLQQLPTAIDSASNPFRWIATVDEVTYDAPGAGQGGQNTDLLSSTKWLNGTQYDTLVLTLTDVERDSQLNVEATDAGVPLHATYHFSIRGRMLSGGGTLLLSGTINYVFSQWGAAIAINPPV